MLDDLGSLFHTGDLANARNVTSVPLHAKFKILVRVEALRVNTELSHHILLLICVSCGLSLDLAGELLNLENHKLGRFERRKTDDDIHDAVIDVALRGR